MNLKFRQLEAFRAVVSAGSTQLAAEQLFITQPAVSRLVKDLECELGFMLFDRSKGKLILSEQGSQFFEALEMHFLGIERLSHTAKAIRQNTVQKLVLACSPVFSTTFLPVCIGAITAQYPTLSVEIHTTELTNIRDMLQHGVIDLAVCLDFPVPSGVVRQFLGQADAVCAMPDGHRLSQKKTIQLSDLNGERIIEWLPISPFMASQEHDLLIQNDIKTESYLKTQTAHTRYALIAAGFGVSIAEPFTAKTWRKLGVTTRPITPSVKFDYILAYQQSLAQSEFLQSILGIVKKSYQVFCKQIAA